MSSILTPLALSIGLNSDPALYDRLQFERLVMPGMTSVASQVAKADVGYSMENIDFSVGGLSSLDKGLSGINAQARIPLKEVMDLILKYEFFNPSFGQSMMGGTFGIGKSHDAKFGPMNGELTATVDSSDYLSGKASGSAQHLNHLIILNLETSHKSAENRQKIFAQYFWKPNDILELGIGVGSSQRGLEGMLNAGLDYSKIRVEVQATGNSQYKVVSAGLSWNAPGRFDEGAIEVNQYLKDQSRKLASQKRKYLDQIAKLKGIKAEDEKELSEHVQDALAKWSNYKRRMPEKVMVEVCEDWRSVMFQVQRVEQSNERAKKALNRFIAGTSAQRYSHVVKSGYYNKGLEAYTSGNLSKAKDYFGDILRVLAGSENHREDDPILISHDLRDYAEIRKLIKSCVDNIERINSKMASLKELETPKPIAVPSAPAPTPSPKLN